MKLGATMLYNALTNEPRITAKTTKTTTTANNLKKIKERETTQLPIARRGHQQYQTRRLRKDIVATSLKVFNAGEPQLYRFTLNCYKTTWIPPPPSKDGNNMKRGRARGSPQRKTHHRCHHHYRFHHHYHHHRQVVVLLLLLVLLQDTNRVQSL